MRKAEPLQGEWWNVLFFLTALLVVAADQLTKLWIRSSLDFGETLVELGFFRIIRIHNTGAAFGLFQDHSFILTIVAIIGIVVVLFFALYVLRRYPYLDSRLARPALGLILGGTIGNLIDRLRFGYITDFIDFRVWPLFNIADSALTVGVILLACSLAFLTSTGSPESAPPPSPEK